MFVLYLLKVIIPQKKPRRGHLNISGHERNIRVSSDRIIVENGLGGVSSLFGIITKNFVWNRDRFDTAVDVFFSLTNYHLSLHPMREENVVYYQRVLSGVAIRTEEVKNYGQIDTH